MQEFANAYFVKGRTGWFKAEAYDELVACTGHDAASPDRKFLVSHDSDPRHSFKTYTAHRHQRDRRDMQPGQPLWMPTDKVRDYVPTGIRVPDCVQSPVEMMFASVKAEYKSLLQARRSERRSVTVNDVVSMMREAFATKALRGDIEKCWEHAMKALRVWCTPRGEWVNIDGVQYRGTGGNWLPRELRG